jgi:hypothetical protein
LRALRVLSAANGSARTLHGKESHTKKHKAKDSLGMPSASILVFTTV